MHLREFLRIGVGIAALSPFAAMGDVLGRSSQKGAHPSNSRVSELLNYADVDDLARQRLSHMAYEYIAGGAGDEITMRWNREAFDAIRLNPRVLVDVQPVDTRVSLFGQEYSFPLLLAPTAFHRLAHREGEVET